MTSRRRQDAAGPTISVILMAGETYVSPAAALVRGEVAEVIPVIGAFDTLAADFADAVARTTGDLVFPMTPDGVLSEPAWQALADAVDASSDAGAFRLRSQGLAAERAWRGRRC